MSKNTLNKALALKPIKLLTLESIFKFQMILSSHFSNVLTPSIKEHLEEPTLAFCSTLCYTAPDWSTGSFRKFETNINNFGIGYFMFSAGFRSFKLNNF